MFNHWWMWHYIRLILSIWKMQVTIIIINFLFYLSKNLLCLYKRCPSYQYFLNKCTNCPTGFSFSNGKCLKISTDSLNYSSATRECAKQNARLAMANSEAKFYYLQSLAYSSSRFWVDEFQIKLTHFFWLIIISFLSLVHVLYMLKFLDITMAQEGFLSI